MSCTLDEPLRLSPITAHPGEAEPGIRLERDALAVVTPDRRRRTPIEGQLRQSVPLQVINMNVGAFGTDRQCQPAAIGGNRGCE